MDEPEIELPRAVALAWGVAANPQRGPKRELSIERIVEVGIQLADAGGLAAVSMSAIAAELGVTPMALYRYVTAKDDLLLLMEDQALGVAPETIREAGERSWREGLETYVREMTARSREHPWALDLPVSGIPVTPNALTWLETALEVLAPTGLSADDQLSAVLAVIAQARWESLVTRGFADAAVAAQASTEQLESRAVRTLRVLVRAEEFPRIRAALDAGALDDQGDGGDPFEFGRGRLLDGLAAAIVAGGDVPRSPAAPDDPTDRDPKVRETVKRVREVEKLLREARKNERQARTNARERARREVRG